MSEGRILVIDDSEFVLARVKSVLVEAGYEVQTTTQTVGAGRYLRACDLILVDFHMPGIDGAAVLESLKHAAKAASNSCSFYLFTSDADMAIRYMSLGFDGAIRNKGDVDSLVSQVRAAFRMKRMRDIARRHKSDPHAAPAPPHYEMGSTSPKTSVPPPHTAHDSTHPVKIGTTPAPSIHQEGSAFGKPAGASTGQAHRSAPPAARSRPSHEEGEDDDPTADFPRTPT